MSEVVLLLLNTDLLQQVEDYVRGCTTSTKYWPPSTSWRLCQRLHYFYQILTSFNKLKIISEVVLLILNTDLLQQVEDCQRLYYFYQILTSFNKLKIMSEVVLLLLNTDLLQQVEDYVRGCTTSTKHWPPSTSWRLYRKIMSEVVLLLPNTDLLQQVEDYIGSCTTNTKYWPPSTSLKIMPEVVLLLLNTDLLQQVEDCQRLYYFYQILTSFNKLKIMSEVVLLLQILTSFNKLKIM